MNLIRSFLAGAVPAAMLTATLLCPGPALAQSRGLLGDFFDRPQTQKTQPPRELAQADGGNGIDSRIDRIENTLRQLTGTIEELQHQNQMMQMQLKRMQDDTEYRFQHMGARSNAPAAPARMTAPGALPGVGAPPANGVPPAPGAQHADVFNPALHPTAPGVPHALGNPSAPVIPQQQPTMANQVPGQSAGQPTGAPLDLSSLAGPRPESSSPGGVPNPQPMGGMPPRGQHSGQLPPPPPRDTSSTGVRLATLPPSASPKDEYELAYGYVLHKDYGLAEQAFRDFLRKYPHEKLEADAQYWLGESQFQQKHYHDAAEAFLAVSTKNARSGKAPKALLRLGQSLAALHQKEAACATFAEVGHKYPHAASSLKRNVTREEKRAHC